MVNVIEAEGTKSSLDEEYVDWPFAQKRL